MIKDKPLRLLSDVSNAQAQTTKNQILYKDGVLPPLQKSDQSPTPSVKRGKAEKLLKEHGSPPGMRVTAGGRVVPTDISPIGSPKFSCNDFSKTGQAYPQIPPITLSTELLPYPVFGCPSYGFEENLYSNQFFEGLSSINETSPRQIHADRYAAWPMNWQIPESSMPPDPSRFYSANSNSQIHYQDYLETMGIGMYEREVMRKLKSLEQHYTKMERNLRDFERHEVLRQESMTSSERYLTVKKKKEMIIELDKIRKSIKDLKGQLEVSRIITANNHWQPNNEHLFSQPSSITSLATQPLAAAPLATNGLDIANLPHLANYNNGNCPPAFIGAQDFRAGPSGTFQTNSSGPDTERDLSAWQQQCQLSPADNRNIASYSKCSEFAAYSKSNHAVPIKDPKGPPDISNGRRTSLNPASPNYEPKQLPAQGRDNYDMSSFQCPQMASCVPTSYLQREKMIGRVSSLSSITTADFFPKNTAEHSSGKHNPSPTEKNHVISQSNRVGPIAPPTSPADLRHYKSATESLGPFFKDTDSSPTQRKVSRVPEDNLIGALAKYQFEKNSFNIPGKVNVDGRSASFIEGLYAGMLHSLIPAITDDEYDKGYCIGLLNSRKDIAKLGKAHPCDVSYQSSSTSSRCGIIQRNGIHQRSNNSSQTFGKDAKISSHKDADLQMAHSTTYLVGDTKINPVDKYGNKITRQTVGLGFDIPNVWTCTKEKRSLTAQTTHDKLENNTLIEGQDPANAPIGTSQTDPFATRVRTYPTPSVYPQKNPGKAGFSIASSNNQANGSLSQFDGAVSELKDIKSTGSNSSSPILATRRLSFLSSNRSPSMSNKKTSHKNTAEIVSSVPKSPTLSHNSQKSSVSPTRAKIGNLTTLIKNSMRPGEEKMDDVNYDGKRVAKDKTRRKENWRENWRKRFQEIKIKEKEEIEKYRRENPVD